MKFKSERLLDYFVLAIFMLLFCSLFDYSTAFTNTHVAGGDMISHPWISKSLKSQWEHGSLWSWNHGWFAGFPFLYFYFYPIYILAVLFEIIGLPEAVAFKTMVLFAVCSVPFLYYVSSRRWLSIPLASMFTAIGLAIFLNELDSRWGGNFKSLLAGQVSHQFGLVMMVCFFSYLATSETNKLGAIFFFSIAILSHVYSGLFSFLILVCYLLSEWLKEKSIKKLLTQLTGPFLALGLSSFFWIPFLYYRKNTVAPINHTAVDLTEVARVLQLTHPLYAAIYISLVIIAMTVLKRKNNYFVGILVGLVLITSTGMMFLNGTPLLHIRLPAEIYLVSLLGLCFGLKSLNLKKSVEWGVLGVIAILILQSVLPSKQLDQALPSFLRNSVRDIPHWWQWNMAGIEEKPASENVMGVWNFLKSIDDNEGRVAVEYGDYNAYGSPRIFELTPYMTGKPIMEGLLLESSPTYPTYYYISFHFNSATWWPGFPVKVPERNVQKGIQYFDLFNVKYFVAAQSQTKQELDTLKIPAIYENGAFKVYKINETSRIASRIVGEVPILESRQPLMQTVLNYPDSLEKVIEIRQGRTFPEEAIKTMESKVKSLVPLEGEWSEDGQSYIVVDTGATEEQPQKILFKVSYFPNWKTNTGEEVRLVTPNLMMVETKSSTLSLTYRAGIPEWFSLFVSLSSLVVLILLKAKKLRTRRITLG